jgi:arsenical pump membrane protein
LLLKGRAVAVDIVIYHNPECGTSRNTLGLIRNAGIEPHVVEYLKTPPSRALLVELIDRAGIDPRDLLREKGTPYAELGLDDTAISDEALVDAMMDYPILINRPLVVSPLGVKLCRPSEAVIDLLPATQLSPFAKEDGELMLLAVLIFVATITLVIWQPKGLGIGWSAMGGAVVALLAGVVSLSDVPVVWDIVWNATGAFVAIIVISLLLDEAGFFEWAALHVARWGKGSGRWLFVLIVLLGAAVSALFANDGAALILTPIVIAMLRALGYKDRATLAFVMAAGFIADTASLPLVVSNLVNIVSADFFKIGFGQYASVMVPVDLVSIAATLGVLLLFFRRDIPATYDMAALRRPSEAIRDAATFRAGWVVLALLLAGFFLLEPLGVPVSAVAAAGALLLLVIAGRGQVIQTRKVLRGAPWQVVIFSLGMYLVVYGLRNAGLTDHLAALLDRTAQGGIWGAALGTGIIAAVLSSVMNNMPTVLVGALSIDAAHATGAVKEAMIYANVIGCDLGPKLTPIGSLATLLWLHVLGQKGIRIGWGYYFRVGITLTVPVLLVTLAALALRITIR